MKPLPEKIKAIFLRLRARLDHWLDEVNPYKPEAIEAQGNQAIQIQDEPVRNRFAQIVLISFAGFALWAVFAPIDAGVNVQGSVVVFGNRKAVQHPSGGVVSKINVREGSLVRQGDVLIEINPLSIEANLNAAELEYITALATESRLAAERNGSELAWLPELLAFADDSRAVEAKQVQQSLYDTRKRDYLGQRQILVEQLTGYTQQLGEQRNIHKLRKGQLQLIAEQTRNISELAAEGYVPRSRANEMERNRNEVLASIATSSSDTSKLIASVGATRLQIAQLDVTFRKEVDGQLTEVQKNRLALKNKVDSLRFDLSLAELKAPASGIVVGLKANTEGGVIQGGQVLMEIVPQDSTLIVEAQVPPHMIDKVHVGLEADMRFSAFNVTTTPVVPGVVKLVGADRVQPADGKGEGFYLAQIETTDKTQALLGGKVIQAGMPVEVIIKSGERSFMSYLLKPITDRFARAFKEN